MIERPPGLDGYVETTVNGYEQIDPNQIVDDSNESGIKVVRPEYLWADEVVAKFPQLRQVIIDGYMRRGESMNVIAAPKSFKTYWAIDLSISVALGQMWLGSVKTYATPVLYLDFELHRETLARRVRDVAGARGIMLDTLHNRLAFESMRGKVTSIDGLRPYMKDIKDRAFGLIVIDAKYRLQASLKGDDQANNNSAETHFYNCADEFAEITGASFLFIHHDNKGFQAGKSVTDRGAGAGSQSRAADCHVTLTPHEEDGCFSVEGVVRSFPPVKPFVMRWDYPRFSIDEALNPANVRKLGSKAGADDEPKLSTTDFVALVFPNDKAIKREVVHARAEKAGVPSNRKANELLACAIDDGIVIEIPVGKAKIYARFKGELHAQ